MHARRMGVAAVALCALFVSVWMLPPATASEGPREPKPLAEMAVGASRVDWQPAGDYERLVLTVAGPGDLFIQREFDAGESPFFSSFDVQGGLLPDGSYAYELRAVPRHNAVANETRPGRRLPEGPLVQWGHLWVQGGSFIDKVVAQPRPSSQRESAPKTPSNVTANTTVPDDLIVEEDLIVDGHACLGNECEGAVTSAPLTIKDLFNYQILFDGGGLHPAKRKWVLQANDYADFFGGFLFRDVFAGTVPFRIGSTVPDNALTIWTNGNVGLGTLTPSTQLHVRSTGSGGKILAENAGSSAAREMLEIRNNGGAVFILDDTGVPERWALGTIVGGSIVMDNQANGGTELTLSNTGNLTVAGTVTPGSSRTIKEELRPVDSRDVLRRVLDLPITSWSYKATPGVRHVGPMSEDFFAAFAVGSDDKGISVTDSAGVALAAIQGLSRQVADVTARKDDEIAQLRRENADLAQRLAALEALVLRSGSQLDPSMAPAP